MTMHLGPRQSYVTMPYPERCREIGDLLGKALVGRFRQLRLQQLAHPHENAKAPRSLDLTALVSDEAEQKMIRHLMIAGDATPVEFRAALGLSRATVFRRLVRLRESGMVSLEGKFRTARYRLRGPDSRN